MGILELNLMKWMQEIVLSTGMIIAFGLVLYFRYPRISSGLKKIFKLKSKKDSKKDKKNVKYTDEEMIDIIQGSIKRYMKKDDYTAKQCIKRIKEIVD